VSTYVGTRQAPGEQRLARYVAGLVAGLVAAASRRRGVAASRRRGVAASQSSDGGHVVAHVLLSRGCPAR